MNAQNPRLRRRRCGAFSMVEMVGVLAIIAILAAVIVPKVFSTIDSSRVTAAASSIGTLQSALSNFVGKYGTVPTTGAASRVDDLLLTAGYLDGRFRVKIGTPPSSPPTAGAAWTYANGAWTASGGSSQDNESRLICQTSTAAEPSASAGTNYWLDGSASLPAGALVVSAVIPNVTASEAQELSSKIDGNAYTPTSTTVADDAGKVVYAAPNAQGLTTVYIYLAHQ